MPLISDRSSFVRRLLLMPFLCLFLVLVLTCNCLFKQRPFFVVCCMHQVYSYGLVLAELLTGRLQV